MRTNFKEYLEKKKAQKIIDKAAKQYAGKKVVLYGAGFFASELLRGYDFSGLNIIGVADKKFQDNTDGDFYGFAKIGSYDLLETDFDVILITTYEDVEVKRFLKDDLLYEEKAHCEIKPLIKMNLLDYIKGVIRDEI